MKIVIELDEILYGEFLTYGIVGLNVDNQIEISKAIRKGTPLPEHHGRLIDADELKQELINKEWITDYDGDGLENIVDEAPTIIEADKESDNK